MFPAGVLIDCASVVAGGLIGSLLSRFLSDELKDSLSKLFGFVAFAVGVTLIVKTKNLGAVVLAVIIGTAIGTVLKLGRGAEKLFSLFNRGFAKNRELSDENMKSLCALFTLCCFSGTGVFGSMNEALNGDSSIIICKAIMDFFTVMIFATKLGLITCSISIPQIAVLLAIFFSAGLLAPVISESAKADFSAVGGIIEIIIAMKILKASDLDAVNSLPALLLIFPVSALWERLLLIL